MVKKSLIWFYSFTTYLIWFSVIIIAGVMLALRYFIFPQINDFREDIAHQISAVAGQRVTIGEIHAGWEGVHPSLDLYQVKLIDSQNRPVLELGHVETALSWLSVVLFEPRLSRFAVHQPELTVRRNSDGNIYVAGISMSGESRPDFLNWLLRQSRVDVIDATVLWQDELRQAPPLMLQKLSLNISSPAWEVLLGRHHFALQATPVVGKSVPIDIRGNVWGRDVAQFKKWHGILYADIQSADIAAWRSWVDLPFDLSQGAGATRFWLNFANGQAAKLTADVILDNVQARFSSNAPETVIQNISGRLNWKRLNNGQQLDGKDLRLIAKAGFGANLQTFRMSSQLIDGHELVDGELSVDELKLDALKTFLSNFPLEKINQLLKDFSPQGRLQETHFSWKGNWSSISNYHLQSGFTGLALNAAHGVPGFSKLSGEFDMTEQSGTLKIDAAHTMLDIKNVLRWPIPADRLSGTAKWQVSGDETSVQVSKLAISNKHLQGVLDFSYRYGGSKTGYLDLSAKFGNANGKYAKYYYPMILSQKTLNWLDSSIIDGHGENVQVIIKGDLDDFPYRDGKKGEFKVKARITDGVLHYANGWPKIRGIGLNMLFSGERMDLSVDKGKIYNAKISQAQVSIPVLDAKHPLLRIQGEIKAKVPDALQFISQSPVADAINHFTEGMTASGDGKLQLDIRLPISDLDATQVQGSYALVNAKLHSAGGFPELDKINGELTFTQSSVSAKNVQTYVYGGPAQFDFDAGPNSYKQVKAQGRIDESGLLQILDHPLLQRVHGATNWVAEITSREKLTQIMVESSLSGLSSDLPPPFNKAAMKNMPLRLEVQQKDARQSLISVTLGEIMSASLLRNQDQHGASIERGIINFGPTSASLPEQPGIMLTGKLDQLNWDVWHAQLFSAESSAMNDSETFIGGAQLEIGVLDIFGRRINGLNIQARQVSDGWSGEVQSREINGNINWSSQGKGRLQARLKSLKIPEPAPDNDLLRNAVDQQQDYPELDISADEFETKNRKLGRLELLASQQGDDWNIEHMRLINPDGMLSVEGGWYNWKSQPDTQVNVNWEIADAGKTMELFGYPGTIKGAKSILAGKLRWNGSPHEFSVAKLAGELELKVSQGQFLKIQPGVGRLMGVLSLQALPRHLLLDFRDLFSEGFAFDSITGTVQIDQGIMKSKDFKMEGAPAKVEISGKTDLNLETLDLRIKVSPKLSDTLSIAALAGGPVTAAATFFAQKLLNDPLNKIAAYEYDIVGTWDNPQEVKSAKDKKQVSTPTPLGR